MRILNLFKVAFRSLLRNKLRSFLTMLGIIIGVASVIAMLAIGEGSNQNIKASVASLGTNSIMVYPGNNAMGGVSQGAASNKTIRVEDVEAIRDNCDLVNFISPVDQKRAQVIYGSQNWNTSILGVTNDYLAIRSLTLAKGSTFTTADDRAVAKVCLVGVTVVLNLFGDENFNPIGEIIRINSIPVKIIGVLSKMGQNTFGQDQDDIILAPFSTVQKRMMSSSMYVNSILASGKSEGQVVDAVDEITNLLRDKHKIAPSDDNDFTVRTQSEISNIFGTISKVMTILLASIASISLLVGGIGIMNIMLVSVTERTREIGIRMAIGAKGKDILTQFMIESIVISFMGGLIGIALGILVAELVATFGGWPVVITVFSVVVSFLFSTIIGLFFGWYPAQKAASLNPIDALRYE
ncbi:ABC transporter permease [Arcicella rosea]|uniref:Putative ABC transport system permease protein n=1 Tax=Arcicella rosea TaxID=502909 RepID=A0A841EK54_9BACT|nr:ABC transporter permease [Arcicella rosea]MBB6002584.1 putative ABC transport system permease protein [Arcicella rosea]